MGRTWRTRGNFKLYDWKCGLLRCNFDLYWEATFHKIASHAVHEFPSKFADLYRKWGKFLASIVLFVLSPNFSCASISQTPLVLQKQMSAAFSVCSLVFHFKNSQNSNTISFSFLFFFSSDADTKIFKLCREAPARSGFRLCPAIQSRNLFCSSVHCSAQCTM